MCVINWVIRQMHRKAYSVVDASWVAQLRHFRMTHHRHDFGEVVDLTR